MASHGLLDACTNGGLGVALLSPFDPTRRFFPFRPILVSPLGVERFFSARGAAVLANELVWVGLPCALLGATLAAWSHRRRRPRVLPLSSARDAPTSPDVGTVSAAGDTLRSR